MFNKYNSLIGILIIWVAHLCIDFMIGVWAAYKTVVSLDLMVAGLMTSFSMLIGEGLQLYFGFLSDRGFHKRFIVSGLILVSTIPFLPYTNNEWILFLFLISCFIGSGAFHPAASSWVSSHFSHSKSIFIALFICGGTLGAALSQSVYIYTYYNLEGQTGVLVIPLLCLVICCLIYSFPKKNQAEFQRYSFKKFLQLIKPKRFELIVLYFITLLFQTVVISFGFVLPDVLRIKGYEEWFCLGGGYFYFILGAALMSVPMGYCVEQFGYKRVLGGVVLSSLILLNLFLSLESLTLFPMMSLLMLMGGTMGVIIPVAVAGGNSLVPSGASGLVSAFYMGGVSCVAGFGPTLIGLIATQFEMDAAVIALQLLSRLFIVALGLVYFLPKRSVAFNMHLEAVIK